MTVVYTKTITTDDKAELLLDENTSFCISVTMIIVFQSLKTIRGVQ